MKKILQNRRGETIVEVVVSFMLLLMFTAMFVVSLRYARAMSRLRLLRRALPDRGDWTELADGIRKREPALQF